MGRTWVGDGGLVTSIGIVNPTAATTTVEASRRRIGMVSLAELAPTGGGSPANLGNPTVTIVTEVNTAYSDIFIGT